MCVETMTGETHTAHTTTILLVEDEALIALAEQNLLESAGYRVVTVHTNETALNAAADSDVGLILMDVDLGNGVSGIDVARTILTVRRIPIVFLTSHSEPDVIAQIRTVTRYGYVLKSSGETVLLEVIRMALELFAEHTALQQSRDLYRSIANLTGDIIVRHDRDGNWAYLNETAHSLWGVPYDAIETLNYLDYVRPEDVDATRDAARQMRDTREPITGLVNRVQTTDGWRTFEWNSAPILDEAGRYLGFQSTGRDITDQKQAEERIRRLLEERDILLREVHHRVRNDLNFVASLLAMQSTNTENETAKRALAEAQERIGVIVRVYELLNNDDRVDTVLLRPLLQALVETLTAGTIPPETRCTVAVDDVTVSVRLSIAIGIIVNELITNANKYAFKKPGSPSAGGDRIHVSGTVVDGSTLRLAVYDTGHGFPSDIATNRRYGFGLTLVSGLVEQHNGRFRVENDVDARHPIGHAGPTPLGDATTDAEVPVDQPHWNGVVAEFPLENGE